ncbi:hypothetical protein BKA62DRAFT_697774 [Auriculariales sp. MPI-PUGE-AT-0066]|nr:hypothetical protein BKA62DRAFT_697774 [Auriculariales sp. MPI-PUGE-AT-0066]
MSSDSTNAATSFEAVIAVAEQRHAEVLQNALAERDAANHQRLTEYTASLQQEFEAASKKREDAYKEDLARRDEEYRVELEQRAANDRAREAELEALRHQHEEIIARLNSASQQHPPQPPPHIPLPTPSDHPSSHPPLPPSPTPTTFRSNHLRFLGTQPQTGPGPARTQRTSVQQRRAQSGPAIRRPQKHQLTKKDFEAMGDITGVLNAISTHYAALSGVIKKRGVMAYPDPAEVNRFNNRFHTAQDADATREGAEIIPQNLVQVARKYGQMQHEGKKAARVSVLEHSVLELMQAECAKYGVTRWAPDPREAATSNWNLAQQHIFIDTFRAAVVAGDYDHKGVSRTFASSRLGDLIKLYRHHTFQVEGSRMQSNDRNPVKFAEKEGRSAVYQDRYRISKRRAKTALNNKHPEHLQRLARSHRAHSETRLNPVTGDRERCAMPHRSKAATAYFEHLDLLAQHDTLPPPPKRVKITDPPSGECKLLPTDASLDFFDPDFYNALPTATRAKLNTNWIALPGDVPFNPRNPALKLSYDDFIAKCGDKISGEYIEEDADPIAGEFSGYDAEESEEMES